MAALVPRSSGEGLGPRESLCRMRGVTQGGGFTTPRPVSQAGGPQVGPDWEAVGTEEGTGAPHAVYSDVTNPRTRREAACIAQSHLGRSLHSHRGAGVGAPDKMASTGSSRAGAAVGGSGLKESGM